MKLFNLVCFPTILSAVILLLKSYSVHGRLRFSLINQGYIKSPFTYADNTIAYIGADMSDPDSCDSGDAGCDTMTFVGGSTGPTGGPSATAKVSVHQIAAGGTRDRTSNTPSINVQYTVAPLTVTVTSVFQASGANGDFATASLSATIDTGVPARELLRQFNVTYLYKMLDSDVIDELIELRKREGGN